MNGNKGEPRLEEPTHAQRTIARRAAESRATIPHLELATDVDVGASLALEGVSLCALAVKACALALRELPRANASYRDGRFELYPRINVGVTLADAIPTVFDADRKSPAELTTELDSLAARAGELSPPELAGATFTLSDVGAAGVASASPVIVPPQAAALCTGAVRVTPVVRDGAIVPGHLMTITLACDHRILYGGEAARFLRTIRTHLERAAL